MLFSDTIEQNQTKGNIMLTKFYPRSSFKTKFTVVTIWSIALTMMVMMVKFILSQEINYLGLISLGILGTFVILGILLRCKIARWFTLLTIYSLFFFPLVNYLMIGEIFPPTLAILYIFLLIISIYSLSNSQAMELFYIDSNPTEHLPLILLSLTINTLYIYQFNVI